MPKVKTNRIKYPDGWELIEPTLRELDAKMREGWASYFFLYSLSYSLPMKVILSYLCLAAENDSHDGKRKCETLWPIFRIAHQRSRYIFDIYYKTNEISKELYEFCLEQGYGDRNLIAKWKKVSFLAIMFLCRYLSTHSDISLC